MFTVSTMPTLTPGDWACHQPPVSSPLRPSQSQPTQQQQNAILSSSPPRPLAQSSPLRPPVFTSQSSASAGAADQQSPFSSFDFTAPTEAKAATDSNASLNSSPPGGLNKFSRFAARQTRPNPLSKKREDEQASRRQLFLRNVRDRADNNRFEKRSIEATAIRGWHDEHQSYLASKAREAQGDDWALDAFIEDALSSQHPDMEEPDFPEDDFDEYPSAAGRDQEDDMQNGPMSEWDIDDDALLDLIQTEERNKHRMHPF